MGGAELPGRYDTLLKRAHTLSLRAVDSPDRLRQAPRPLRPVAFEPALRSPAHLDTCSRSIAAGPPPGSRLSPPDRTFAGIG